ncbi:MAG: YncE family protein, partial [Pirellula sp.]
MRLSAIQRVLVTGLFSSFWGLFPPAGSGQENSQQVSDRDREWVGGSIDESIVTPVNQRLTPIGKWLDLPGMRPQVIALAPDGKIAVTSGKASKLVVIDPASNTILQEVEFPSEDSKFALDKAAANNLKPDTKAIASFTGLVFSPDGRWIYLSNVQGSIKVFSVDESSKVSPAYTMRLPDANAPQRKQEIPSGLAISDDGKRLYVCGNLSNRLIEIDLANSLVKRTFDVGVAPYDVKLSGGKAIVSNWGGRRPEAGDLVGPAGKGTRVRVDPVRYIASEGSVSIIELEGGKTDEILVGLHPSGLAISPDGKFAVCANAASDYLSVVDLTTLEVVDKIWTKSNPAELFGASPNAIVFGRESDELYVANGTQNAIAVVEFEPERKGESRLRGMVPVGWFPGAIVYDSRRDSLLVANIKGLPREPKKQGNSKGF